MHLYWQRILWNKTLATANVITLSASLRIFTGLHAIKSTFSSCPSKFHSYTVHNKYRIHKTHIFTAIATSIGDSPFLNWLILGHAGCSHHVTHPGHGVLLNNSPDLWLKPHVQHPVCFIQYKKIYSKNNMYLKHINDTPRLNTTQTH